jgi:trimeric autotransporter adhesin
MKNANTTFTAILIALACFALLPLAQAVVPPPDGGYPNFTTAEGTNALKNLTSGAGNTGIGWFSLFSDTTASFNTAVGVGTLLFNNGDENTAIGAATLLFNIAGGNTAVGSRALLNNTTGGTLGNIQGIDVGPNVAVGQQALESNTVASANTAVGYQALHSFTTGPVGLEQLGLCTAVGFQALANATGDGFGNSGFGYQTLRNNTDGALNTAIGLAALAANTTGGNNVAMGANALSANTTGDNNTANGATALVSNTTGDNNTAIGTFALTTNTTGESNTAIGHAALQANTASFNTAIGEGALTGNAIGTSNTAVGTNALQFSNGIANIALGDGAGNGVTTADNVICIGTVGANVGNSCYIGNIFGATSPGGIGVLVNSDGKLGTTVSSRRFKEDIKPMDEASAALLALQPVTFRYKKQFDAVGAPQFGLVAEDVEKVNPDLIVRDKEGKPYSVRYDQVNAMLLNEFLKEHKTVQEQGATITQQRKDFEAALALQQKQIEALTAGLQRVSAQLEASKPAPQVANNP